MNDYKIEVEIYEGKGGELRKEGDQVIYSEIVIEGICAWMYRGDGNRSYQVGEWFNYPEDAGRLFPCLLDSLHGIIHTLRFGGMLPWQYSETLYEKKWIQKG